MSSHVPVLLRGPRSKSRVWWQGSSPDSEVGFGGQADSDDRKRPDPDAPIRQDLVDRVRREIAAGTYDTPEKWEQALRRLHRSWDSEK